MHTLIKLGGSLITDKRVENSFNADIMRRLAHEIAQAQKTAPTSLIIGHGSGSFGHFAAHKYGTMEGVSTPENWRGFAEVARVAGELNKLVMDELVAVGLPILKLQPSASALCHDGELIQMALHPLEVALTNGLVPLVYGDVSLDDVRGGTIISTETIMTYLSKNLPVKRVFLLGEVEGVLDADGNVIPRITPNTLAHYQSALGGSYGTDVTGGMFAKVRDMVNLVKERPHLSIRILNGQVKNRLLYALTEDLQTGTLITND
ncbi:MAG: isopentenyl phosphate kinase [bacterium]|nr:isopentenyl phosphate kinase [bacterium]